jgi:hypothetical protein
VHILGGRVAVAWESSLATCSLVSVTVASSVISIGSFASSKDSSSSSAVALSLRASNLLEDDCGDSDTFFFFFF